VAVTTGITDFLLLIFINWLFYFFFFYFTYLTSVLIYSDLTLLTATIVSIDYTTFPDVPVNQHFKDVSSSTVLLR